MQNEDITTRVTIDKTYVDGIVNAVGKNLEDSTLLADTLKTVASGVHKRIQVHIAQKVEQEFIDQFTSEFQEIMETHVKLQVRNILQSQVAAMLDSIKIEYTGVLFTTGQDTVMEELSKQTRKVLAHNGIHTLSDLLLRSPDDLRGLHNFGAKAMREVTEVLGLHGLSLAAMNYTAL